MVDMIILEWKGRKVIKVRQRLMDAKFARGFL